jgi:nitrogen regulatory protein PII
MKMIWAVVPQGCAEDVISALRTAGIQPVTCVDASGFFDSVPVTPAGTTVCDAPDGKLLVTAVADHDVPKAVLAIRETAKAYGKEMPQQETNGKIFVSYVDDFYTVRPGRKGRDGPA